MNVAMSQEFKHIIIIIIITIIIIFMSLHVSFKRNLSQGLVLEVS